MAVLGALGDLVLALSADTAKFQSDLGRAQRMSDKFGREVGRVLGNIAGGLVALGGAAGFGALVKGQIDAADAAGKMGQKIGITTEALSAYMVAAKLSDVSNEQLQTGFQQLAKNQADFVAGTGEAKDAFAALGITTQQLNSLNGDTAAIFELVAGKLASFEDGANKTAIAMKIFGKSGAELIPMINSLEQTRKEAAMLNAIIDKETAASAERFNDNLTRVGVVVQALGLNIAKAVLPTLEKMSESMVQAARDAEVLGRAGSAADGGLKGLVSVGSLIATAFSVAGKGLGAFAAAMDLLKKGEFRAALAAIQEGAVDVRDELSNTGAFIKKIWTDTANDVSSKAPETGKKLAAPALVATEAAKKAAKEAADAYAKAFEFEENVQREANDATNEYLQRQGELNAKAAEDQKEMWRQVYETIDQEQEDSIEQGRVLLDGLEAQAKRNAEIGRQLGLTFSSAFEDAIVKGEKFSDVLRGIEQDIARLIIRKSITEPAADAISNFIGGINLLGGGGIASDFTGSFAEGTDYVPRTGFAYVHKGEAIIPADQNRPGPMGNTVNIFPDLRGASAEAVEALHRMVVGLNASVEPRSVAAVERAFTKAGRRSGMAS